MRKLVQSWKRAAVTDRSHDKLAGRGSPTIALVECSVRVSPTLARLIRKCAEKEASGVPAKDALLGAADIQLGELTTLRSEIERISREADEWRAEIARERVQLERSMAIVGQRDKEIAVLRGDLRKANNTSNEARLKIEDAARRVAEITAVLEDKEAQLTQSLSLLGLDDGARTAVTTLRDRVTQGDVRFLCASEAEAMMANLDRPEMRTLNNLLTHPGWRLPIVRWLLRLRTKS
jgi:hypothetical protein